MSVPLLYPISSIEQNKILDSLNVLLGEGAGRGINKTNMLDIFFFNFQRSALVGRCPLRTFAVKQSSYPCFVLSSVAL